MQQDNEKKMERLKQSLILCLLSCATAVHAGSAQPYMPEMVTVPAGKFVMGSLPSEPGWSNSEEPTHVVVIAKPFAVGKYEVTFDEWDSCVADGGCDGYRPNDNGWGRGKRPVIYVNWDDAHAYIEWLNKKTGQHFRLLSEAEWEYAARAGTTTTYYWGNDVGQNNANCDPCGSKYSGKQTAPVGSFKPNSFGLYDMLGNVWEWTEDAYVNDYNGAPADGSARHDANTERRVQRGGSWTESAKLLRAGNRGRARAMLRNPLTGFRLARSLP